MTKQFLIAFSLLCIMSISAFSQKNDPVLFTVNDIPVHVSEFQYIYSKTNGTEADFSKKSLEEYLDLYIKFKLKVAKAKEMQLDTIPQLQSELEGYRRQLADSYLIDKEVTEKLLREAYERSKEDVDISHIMVRLTPNATPQDTLKAYLKVMEAKKRLESGDDFAAVAKELSEDQSAAKNGGHVGYVTALFPKGLYPLETAAYNNKLGTISGPIRTSSSYHILKVHQRRPARGEMEAAHIMLRTKGKDPNAVKATADSLYNELQKGADFAELAKAYSEDRNSAAKGGNIGFFGINRYEKPFEDAAFGLQADGDICKPVQTSIGWHIIKRISKQTIQPYNIEKNRLSKGIQEDTRFEQAKDAMVKKIKKEANFKEKELVLDNYIESLTDTFLTFRWKAPKVPSQEILFTMGKDVAVTLGDFTNYLGKSSRERLRKGRNNTPEAVATELYNDFVHQEVMKYEESRLEAKYPEFKSLMREYEEGILLFEATKMEVWDKASQDTVGLEAFFKTIEGKYRWEERAVVYEFQVKADEGSIAQAVADFAKTHSPEEVLEKYNTPEKVMVVVEEKTFEKSRNQAFSEMKWEVGATSFPDKKKRNPYYQFLKIKELLPVSDKSLGEARGYIVADYQDQLEREWVAELRKAYEVKVNQNVFDQMVKK